MFHVWVFFFLLWHCFCVFLLMFACFLYLLLVHFCINKDVNYLESNNNTLLNDLWLLFSTAFLFLKVWFDRTSNIKLRLFVILVVYILLYLHKQVKAPGHHEAIRNCSRYQCFIIIWLHWCLWQYSEIDNQTNRKSSLNFKS